MTHEKADFISITERMASAIEAAIPRIEGMWSSFPYAEMDGDDEAMHELRVSAALWRQFQKDMMHDAPRGDGC